MAWTAPNTHATGDVLPASDWNTYVRDNTKYLHGDGGATIDLSAGGQAVRLANLLDLGQSAAGQTGQLRIFAPTTLASAILVYKTTDAQPTFQVTQDGVIHLGPGGATVPDANLYRLSSGGNLQTDGTLWIGASAVVSAVGGGTLYVGAALDTFMQRVVAGQLALSSKLLEGNPALASVAVPGTFTPNLATGLTQRVNVPSGGASTLTIGAPTNPPSGTQTSLLVVHIANNGGGTITLSWNAAYTANAGSALALPTSRATATVTECLFAWDGAIWRLLAVG